MEQVFLGNPVARVAGERVPIEVETHVLGHLDLSLRSAASDGRHAYLAGFQDDGGWVVLAMDPKDSRVLSRIEGLPHGQLVSGETGAFLFGYSVLSSTYSPYVLRPGGAERLYQPLPSGLIPRTGWSWQDQVWLQAEVPDETAPGGIAWEQHQIDLREGSLRPAPVEGGELLETGELLSITGIGSTIAGRLVPGGRDAWPPTPQEEETWLRIDLEAGRVTGALPSFPLTWMSDGGLLDPDHLLLAGLQSEGDSYTLTPMSQLLVVGDFETGRWHLTNPSCVDEPILGATILQIEGGLAVVHVDLGRGLLLTTITPR